MAMFDNSTVSSDNSSSLIVELLDTGTGLEIALVVKYYIALIRISVLYPLGVIGSVLTILVVCHSKLGRNSFTFYLLVLAVSDGLRLIFAFIQIIPFVIQWPRPRLLCKMTYFMNYFTSVLSDITVMTVSIERAIAVVIPHKVKLILSLKRVIFVIIIFIVGDVLANIHILFTIDSNGFGGCATVLVYIHISQFFFVITMLIFTVCVAVNMICTILIIYSLRRRSIQFAGSYSGRDNKETQITFMLVSISLLYLVSTLPLLVRYFYAFFISKKGQGAPVDSVRMISILLNQTTLLLKDIGHVGNFYIYCMSASIFRMAFKGLISSYMRTCR